jgi:hypothetical protein
VKDFSILQGQLRSWDALAGNLIKTPVEPIVKCGELTKGALYKAQDLQL